MWRLLVLTFAVVRAEVFTEDADHNIHVFQDPSGGQQLLRHKNVKRNGKYIPTMNVHGNLVVEESTIIKGTLTANSIQIGSSANLVEDDVINLLRLSQCIVPPAVSSITPST